MMGINRGETDSDLTDGPGPTERTWCRDFNDDKSGPPSKNSIRWRKIANYFTHGEPLVITELFFWSSPDRKALEKKFGALWESSHLDFCTRMNRILIEVYQPKAVIFTGTGEANKVADKFGLHHYRDICRNYVRRSGRQKGERVDVGIVKHYRDTPCPWFFIRHPTAAFGVSRTELEDARTYIHANL